MSRFQAVSLVLSLLVVGCSEQSTFLKSGIGATCKSCSPYNIRGNWYYPQNHYEYDETGMASWYGPGFHGKPKPYGERYDQNDISAAHKTLPLPTVVLVTNLDNGKALKLIIDDRGPFIDNRLIDLSVEAAKALGIYQKGLGRVRIQSLVEESKAFSNHLFKLGRKTGRDPNGRSWNQVFKEDISQVYEKPTISPLTPAVETDTKSLEEVIQKNQVGTMFYVEIGVFLHFSNAQKLVRELHSLLPIKLEKKTTPKGQSFHLVLVGPYTTSSRAEEACRLLEAAGHTRTTIIKRS